MVRHFLILAVLICLSRDVFGDTNYRLNTPIKPSSYAVSITPYFDTGDELAFTFDGEVTITVFTDSNTNQIQLHSEDLSYTAANITVARGNTVVNLNASNPLEYDTKYDFVYINLEAELQAGVEYNIRIVYRGKIRDDLNGFYRNYYIENGVKKWLGATQMESTHARKVFPCFDEPGLKATFTLTIDRPESYQPSLTNMKMQYSTPLSNGYVREIFYPSPKMPTYLVAFLVSEFTAAHYNTNGTREFGVFTRPEANNQSQYAFDFGLRVVDALSNYLGVDYYSTDINLKLDHVALPDFRAGAMENWGLVTYRESLLLYVPEVSTPFYKYRVAQIIAHETTHMWFGDLVTCHWWSNTWLNEGFANYFQDYITSLIEPEVGSADILVTGSVYTAYDADDDTDAVPITNENVNSPAEISGHFSAISYQKAGSVIMMIHHLIGDEAFKHGLNTYLNANQFDSGYPNLMYAALDQGATVANALSAYPGFTVTDIMSSWISQAGHPIVKVHIDYEDGTVSLTQERFYIDSEDSSSELYSIPISYTTGISPDFDNTKPAFIMNEKSVEFTISNLSETHSWVIFNVQETGKDELKYVATVPVDTMPYLYRDVLNKVLNTGLYRVNYDDHSWEIITSALKGDQRERIHNLNRAKIVNDLFAFLYADEVDFSRLYDVLGFLSDETDFSVWFAAIRGMNKLRTSFLGSDALDLIENYERGLLDSIINRLGYEINSSEGTVALRNRMQVLEYACKIGHQGCIDHAVALFQALKENGTEITPSLRPVVYCNGLRHGDGDDYEFLWNRMRTTNFENEARTIGETLGCTGNEDKLRKFLVSPLEENSPIRTQDLTVPLVGVLAHYGNVRLVLDELQQNFTLWTTIYGSMDTVLTTIASALHTGAEFNEFDSWLLSCNQCTEQSVESARKAWNSAKHSAEWAQAHEADILRSIRNHASSKTTSLITLIGFITVVCFNI